MDILDFIIQKQRQRKFAESPQITLGQLIEDLQTIGVFDEEGKSKTICYDFGTAVPTTVSSWRGSPDELALGYVLTGHDSGDHSDDPFASDLLTHLKESIGKTFVGWKGGEFKMTEKTPVWVANSGNSGNTGIVGLLDKGYRIIIITCYCEYLM